jgi:hypothetical protein
MILETLIGTVLDEAEAIVRAEWLRLQGDCPGGVVTTVEVAGRPRSGPPRPRQEQLSRRDALQHVWPTQRSPPRRCGFAGNQLSNGGDALDNDYWAMTRAPSAEVRSLCNSAHRSLLTEHACAPPPTVAHPMRTAPEGIA